jgi:glyoxylase-like metal-dependent hydrolase (beta-lactamase superfamily II)
MRSRREFIGSAIGTVTACIFGGLAFDAFAQEASLTTAQMRAGGAKAQLSVKPLRKNVSMVSGSGGNFLVLSGKEGKLAVDSGFATSKVQMEQAFSGISDEPLKLLVNTHWHFDHTDGNEWMHATGATIISHSQTLDRMSHRQVIPEFEGIYPPSPRGALPTVTFEHTKVLQVNGDELRLARHTPAHTDSDISVYFTGADILHTGDTWFNGIYPFIDYNTGGSIDGMIAASKENLEIAGRSTIVVPGHGASGGRDDLAAFHQMLVDMRTSIASLKRSGASAQEVLARRPTTPYDKVWGSGFISPDLFTSLVYRGV